MQSSLVPSRPTHGGKERLVTIVRIPGPNTSQRLRYVVIVEWQFYGFADYHEICEYVAMAAFALTESEL